MPVYRQQLLEAKNAYKAKDYRKAYELYSHLYKEVPFDNSARYSYAWTIYQLRVKEHHTREQLIEDAELITELTRQNNLNYTRMCVYTMSVFKVLKLLYSEKDYESLPHWLDKINPDLLDEIRFTKEDKTYPSNRENYYIYASVTYFKLADYEKCIEVSREALRTLRKFTNNSAEFFQWRLAKSLRQIGEYAESLKFLNILQLDEWYVYHEIAENYYFLDDPESSLKYAVKAALKDGPMDMKYNLYNLLYNLLEDTDPVHAELHHELCEAILDGEDHERLEDELYDFWKTLNTT